MTIKNLLPIIFVFCLFPISYSQTTKKYRKLQLPKLIYQNYEERHKDLKMEILNKIIYPLICQNDKSIKEVIVDFCPPIMGLRENELGCENQAKGELTISIEVIGFPFQQSPAGFIYKNWIEISKGNNFDKDSYLNFNSNGVKAIPKKGCASEK